MGQRRGPSAARQYEAGLQERQVKAAAVERHQTTRPLEQGGQRGQQRRLFVEIAHEMLDDDEAIAIEPPRPNQKRIRARAAGEAGGLRVEEEQALRLQ